jgi:hypothetical protein
MEDVLNIYKILTVKPGGKRSTRYLVGLFGETTNEYRILLKCLKGRACGRIVDKALCYKPESRGFDYQ